MRNGQQRSLTAFKVLLIGSSGVGKSSLLIKYVRNMFEYDYKVTTGVQYFTKNIKVNERASIKLQIWDTMGQEGFKSVVRSFYKGVSAVLLVYSIDKRESFDQLAEWMNEIRDHAHEECLLWVVGCKLDLEDIRQVPKKLAEEYAKSVAAIASVELSAKTGENVKQTFDKIGKVLHKKYHSSSNFKQLVQPMYNQDQFAKAQSFNLNSRTSQVSNLGGGCC